MSQGGALAHRDRWRTTRPTRIALRRYLDSYGPVRCVDLVWWTGLPARQIDDALLITAEGAHDAAAVESGPVAINLVPMLDPYTMGYKDRRRLLDPQLNEAVVDRGGNVTSVVLVDGRVAGVGDLAEDPWPIARVLLFRRRPPPAPSIAAGRVA